MGKVGGEGGIAFTLGLLGCISQSMFVALSFARARRSLLDSFSVFSEIVIYVPPAANLFLQFIGQLNYELRYQQMLIYIHVQYTYTVIRNMIVFQ